MREEYQIRKSETKHLKALAEVYRDAFPDSLYVRFGTKYCMQMLNWFLSRENSLFHIEIEGEIAGFYGTMLYDRSGIPGSTSSIIRFTAKEALRSVLRNPLRLLDPKILQHSGLIFNNLWIKIKEKLFGRKKAIHQPDSAIPFTPYLSLVAIGVHSRYQNKGLGKALLRHLIALGKELNVAKIRLTVRAENAQAIAAYKSCGFFEDGAHDKSIGMTLLLT